MGIGDRDFLVGSQNPFRVPISGRAIISHGMVDTYGLGFLDEADRLIGSWH